MLLEEALLREFLMKILRILAVKWRGTLTKFQHVFFPGKKKCHGIFSDRCLNGVAGATGAIGRKIAATDASKCTYSC